MNISLKTDACGARTCDLKLTSLIPPTVPLGRSYFDQVHKFKKIIDRFMNEGHEKILTDAISKVGIPNKVISYKHLKSLCFKSHQ
jgi:hypothetical protein